MARAAVASPLDQAIDACRTKVEASKESPFGAFGRRYWSDPAGFVRDIVGAEPTVYQAEFMGELPVKKRIAGRGPHGWGKCLSATEEVRLADGRLIPAAQLVGASFDILSMVPDGDGIVRAARAFATDNGVEELIEIETTAGRVIRRTKNHPLWADTTPKRWAKPEYSLRLRPQGSWVQTSELATGSVVCVAVGHAPNDSAPVSDDDIKLAAYLIGDGGLSGGKIMFSQGQGPALVEFGAICARMMCRLTSSAYDHRVSGMVGAPRGRRSNAVVNRCRDWGIFGKTSHEKRFPSWVWQLGQARLGLFLSRLYACDGWAHSKSQVSGRVNREIGYCTVNPGLAQDVCRALLRLGVVAAIRAKKTTWTHRGVRKRGSAFAIDIHDNENVARFAAMSGIFGKEEAVARVAASCAASSGKEQQKWKHHGLPCGFVWERVKTVRVLPAGPTVAITVPGSETYITDFLEHNSTSQAWLTWWFSLTRDALKTDWKDITTAGTWRQLEKYLWPEIHKWGKRIRWDLVGRPPVREGRELGVLHLKLEHGEAFAVASNDHGKIEGAHADQLLFQYDEAKLIPVQTWDASEGAFSGAGVDGREAFAAATSTPGADDGRFYGIHARKPGLEDWWPRHVTLEEAIAAGRISRSWADQRRKLWGGNSAVFLNRVLGEFATGANSRKVIQLADVERAIERGYELLDRLVPDPLNELGVEERWKLAIPRLGRQTAISLDVGHGGLGRDPAAIAKRHGNIVLPLEMPPPAKDMYATEMDLCGRIAASVKAKGGGSAVDAIGAAALVGRLRELGVPVVPFIASARSDRTDVTGDLGFVDQRAEVWIVMGERLHDPSSEVVLPDDATLIGELTEPEILGVNSAAKIRVEGKSEIAKRLRGREDRADEGGSTNRADAVVTLWAEGIEVSEDSSSDNEDAVLYEQREADWI